ncbi:MAG TPA: ABC transporter permease, partial [Bacteroidia bacterium]|nr:ABC transporter permease [Bacteroidia bacterium]
KGLVVFQFAIATALIIGTSLILEQLKFLQNKKLGLNKEQILQVELLAADLPKAQTLIEAFSQNPHVISATLNDFSFKGIPAITMLPEGAAQNELVAHNVISADEDFLRTFQLELVSGRDFSRDFPSDRKEAFIVNESAVKSFNWGTNKQALGKKIDWAFGKTGKVVGVVKDFNYSSLHNGISPLLIHIFPSFHRRLSVRLRPEDIPETVSALESVWKNTIAESPFKYAFMEENYNNLYIAEKNMKSVLSAFTILSVFVACLGLFGLAAFTIRQRYKEIGIRKVLGADIRDIVKLLSKDFLKLVLISVLVAIPIAWFAIDRWLRDFAYKVTVDMWIFIFAGLAALLIALLTVSLQAVRAAVANPVKSIRTEV